MYKKPTLARAVIYLGFVLLCGCDPASPADTATGASTSTPRPQAHATVPATWILPGDFSPDATLQDLQRRFGAGNVKVEEIPGAEGGSFRGVVLFPDDPSRRATVYFQDPQNLLGLAMVSIDEDRSQWKLSSGVGIGTPLSELRKANGKPFTFSGFGWDHGGTIIDWHGGKLTPAGDGAVFARVQLRLPQDGISDKSYPQGDSRFSSDDPRWKGLGIAVSGFSINFPGEDDL